MLMNSIHFSSFVSDNSPGGIQIKIFSTSSPFVYQEGIIWLQGKKERKREEHFPFYLGTIGGQPFHLTCLDLYPNMSTLKHFWDFSFF